MKQGERHRTQSPISSKRPRASGHVARNTRRTQGMPQYQRKACVTVGAPQVRIAEASETVSRQSGPACQSKKVRVPHDGIGEGCWRGLFVRSRRHLPAGVESRALIAADVAEIACAAGERASITGRRRIGRARAGAVLPVRGGGHIDRKGEHFLSPNRSSPCMRVSLLEVNRCLGCHRGVWWPNAKTKRGYVRG